MHRYEAVRRVFVARLEQYHFQVPADLRLPAATDSALDHALGLASLFGGTSRTNTVSMAAGTVAILLLVVSPLGRRGRTAVKAACACVTHRQ